MRMLLGATSCTKEGGRADKSAGPQRATTTTKPQGALYAKAVQPETSRAQPATHLHTRIEADVWIPHYQWVPGKPSVIGGVLHHLWPRAA